MSKHATRTDTVKTDHRSARIGRRHAVTVDLPIGMACFVGHGLRVMQRDLSVHDCAHSHHRRCSGTTPHQQTAGAPSNCTMGKGRTLPLTVILRGMTRACASFVYAVDARAHEKDTPSDHDPRSCHHSSASADSSAPGEWHALFVDAVDPHASRGS